MITIEQLILQIEQRQPVLNKANLNAALLNKKLSGVGSLSHAKDDEISFLSSAQFEASLANSNAAVILVTPKFEALVPKSSVALVVADPYLAYASSSQLFAYCANSGHIHSSAVIASSAVIGKNVSIGAFCVIGEAAIIGDNSCLDAHVVIEDGVVIGRSAVIKPHTTIAHHCVIGDFVRLHSGVSIGSEGFGFAATHDRSELGWERIAQLGRVVIGDHVRIGSQTCIDRGAVDDTVIGNHVIIDNLVQIAHNVKIGDGTAIAAKTGIAGSTSIGKRCIIGGAVGINGHITICDDVTLSGMTMVTKSIKSAGAYSSGTTAMPTPNWRRAAVRFRKLGNK